jgi:hypothetical protein
MGKEPPLSEKSVEQWCVTSPHHRYQYQWVPVLYSRWFLHRTPYKARCCKQLHAHWHAHTRRIVCAFIASARERHERARRMLHAGTDHSTALPMDL